MPLSEVKTIEEALAAIVTERERRHWTIPRWRDEYGDEWPKACAETRQGHDEGVDTLAGRVSQLEAALQLIASSRDVPTDAWKSHARAALSGGGE